MSISTIFPPLTVKPPTENRRPSRVETAPEAPLTLDLLDARAVRKAVLETQPDAIVHQATALADLGDLKHLDEAATGAGGIALRYGGFYGAANDGMVEPVRKRQFPIVGKGGGVSSFIHLDDAAGATVLALEHDGAAVYNIVDDEPASVREWPPVLAEVLGAKPPRRLPRWLARLFAGDAVVMMGTESRGASNAKAKRELGWELRHPGWRQGFLASYASATGHSSG